MIRITNLLTHTHTHTQTHTHTHTHTGTDIQTQREKSTNTNSHTSTQHTNINQSYVTKLGYLAKKNLIKQTNQLYWQKCHPRPHQISLALASVSLKLLMLFVVMAAKENIEYRDILFNLKCRPVKRSIGQSPCLSLIAFTNYIN